MDGLRAVRDGDSGGLLVFWTRGKREDAARFDAVLLHRGVTPNLNLARAAGCDPDWHDGNACFVPRTGDWGRTTVPGVLLAGDGAGISVAETAAPGGRIAALAALAGLGATGPKQLKAWLRCGMGPCQGRMCGLAVAETVAAARGVAPTEVGYLRLRTPERPVTLAQVAALPRGEAERRAVERP